MSTKRSVLITGCSDGGTGSALAIEFCKAGLQVYATARNVGKMENLSPYDVELLELDIESDASIAKCVERVEAIDILVNNAGAQYTMPISDISILDAKKVFDANVWGHIALVQAFIPLLLKSPKPIIANHTSVGSGVGIPFQSVYNASKAAFSMFSDIMRAELQPFNITVVNLKTAGVKTNVITNLQTKHPKIPEGSIYAPAGEIVNRILRLEWAQGIGISPEDWAKGVAGELLKASPPAYIWKGESVLMARLSSLLPSTQLDGLFKRMTGLDKVETVIREKRGLLAGSDSTMSEQR